MEKDNEEIMTIEMDGLIASAEIVRAKVDRTNGMILNTVEVRLSGVEEPKKLMSIVKKIYKEIHDE